MMPPITGLTYPVFLFHSTPTGGYSGSARNLQVQIKMQIDQVPPCTAMSCLLEKAKLSFSEVKSR